MKNKLSLSLIACCLSTTLNATSLFTNDMIKLFNDDFFNTAHNQYIVNFQTASPKMNLFEKIDKYIFEFELVGLNKKDIKVSVNDKNLLTISGTKKKLSKNDQQEMIIQEHFYGSFSRSISLPNNINKDTIKVSYKNGILQIIIEKDLTKNKQKIKFLTID